LAMLVSKLKALRSEQNQDRRSGKSGTWSGVTQIQQFMMLKVGTASIAMYYKLTKIKKSLT